MRGSEAAMDNPRRQPSKRKRQLAWTAYLALTDAAHWLEAQLRTPLDVFGLSREEFRLMVLLHREGGLKLSEAEVKLGRSRESMFATIQRAEDFGWVRRGATHLPLAKSTASRVAKAPQGNPRAGRRVGTVELTSEGERLIGNVLPRQQGMLRALLAGLDSREMKTLIRTCEKITREDDFTKMRFAAALIRAGKGLYQEEQGGESEDED
jgi:DNA-binding MarR family transcriptional regulator